MLDISSMMECPVLLFVDLLLYLHCPAADSLWKSILSLLCLGDVNKEQIKMAVGLRNSAACDESPCWTAPEQKSSIKRQLCRN